MATFKSRVEQLSGQAPNDDVLSDWLTAGTRMLSNLIPNEELERYITAINATENGVTITDAILYGVTKDGYIARKIDISRSYGLNRRDSLYFPSPKTPIYLLTGKTIKVFPDGGQVWMLPLYVVLSSESSIQNFPVQLEHAVVLYASIANKTQQMQAYMPSIVVAYNNAVSGAISSTVIADLPQPVSYGPVVAPELAVFTGTAPTAPVFTDIAIPSGVTIPAQLSATTNILFQNASVIGINAESIANFPTAPSFTKITDPPIYTDFINKIKEIDAITAPTAPTFETFTKTAPVAPVFTEIVLPSSLVIPAEFSQAIGVLFQEANEVGITSEQIGTFPTAPVFTKTTDIPTYTDFDAKIAEAELLEAPVPPEYLTFDEEFPTPPVFVAVVLPESVSIPDELTEITNILFEDADVFGITAEVIAAYPTAPVFDTVYEAPSYEDFDTKADADDVEIAQVYIQKVAREQEDWQQKVNDELQLFNSKYQVYREDTNKIIEQARTNLQQKIADAQSNNNTEQFNKLKKYESTVEEYSLQLRRYQANVDRYVQIVNSEIARLTANVQLETQIYSAHINALSVQSRVIAEQNQIYIQDYTAQINAYSIQTRTIIDVADAYLREIAQKIQQWQTSANEELQKFNSEYQVFRENTNKLIEQSKINLQQKIQDAQEKNQIEQFNKLKSYESTVEKFSAELRKYQANVERYVQIVNTEINIQTSTIQAKTQVYSAQVSGFATESNVVNEKNQVLVQRYNADVNAYTNRTQSIIQTAGAYIQQITKKQEDWQIKVNEELQEFNAQYQVFREDTNKIIEQAKINLQQKIADAQDKNQTEQFNKLKAYEATVQEFESQLRLYQSNIDRYVQIVNSEVSRQSAIIQAKTQVYSSEVNAFSVQAGVVSERNQVLISDFNARMQNEVSKYQAGLATYQAITQKNIQQAELTQQRLIQQSAQDSDVSKTNETAKMQALIQEYQVKLGRLNSMQVEVSSLVSQYADAVQKYMFKRYMPVNQQQQ